ncbi:MAG: DUF3883 domain-containing protein [Bacteroidetes bacterium]|nr:DUF3883 domain-containing protein [Bacteroidota bacterium]
MKTKPQLSDYNLTAEKIAFVKRERKRQDSTFFTLIVSLRQLVLIAVGFFAWITYKPALFMGNFKEEAEASTFLFFILFFLTLILFFGWLFFFALSGTLLDRLFLSIKLKKYGMTLDEYDTISSRISWEKMYPNSKSVLKEYEHEITQETKQNPENIQDFETMTDEQRFVFIKNKLEKNGQFTIDDFEPITDLDDIFTKDEVSDTDKNIGERKNNLNKKTKEDYLETYSNNQTLGELGELFVMRVEKKKLTDLNRADLANKVVHASQRSDSLGYDIQSYNEKGEKIFIEVKTTESGLNTQFFLTKNEYEQITKPNYVIYRVFNFNTKTNIGEIYIINSHEKLKDFFSITPNGYVLKPNR